MSRTDVFDLGALRLTAGEGRRIDLDVPLAGLRFGADFYAAALHGPCMRCLGEAEPSTNVDAREVDQPGGGEELASPYLEGQELDIAGWARDAFALAIPVQVVCRVDCAGLCSVCGEDLNRAGPDHAHDPAPDPRWAKLGELKFE